MSVSEQFPECPECSNQTLDFYRFDVNRRQESVGMFHCPVCSLRWSDVVIWSWGNTYPKVSLIIGPLQGFSVD